MKLQVQSFKGIGPKMPARYLADGMSQVAVNVETLGHELAPMHEAGESVATLSHSGNLQTIYRFGQDLTTGAQHWFAWAADVDVCRGQVSGDPAEWTFYTGDGFPKATTNSLALGTSPPVNWRRLGIPAPSTKLSVTVDNPPAEVEQEGRDGEPEIVEVDRGLPDSRVYTYTWVSVLDGLSMESAPAPASAIADVYLDSAVQVSGFQSSPGGAGVVVTGIRLYRSVNGIYLFVEEIAASTHTYTDTKTAEELNEEIPSTAWDVPPENLEGLTNLPNGIMAGFVGRDVWFCDPYRPYAWPMDYMQSLDAPIVGLGRMDTTLAVLTKGNPYFIQGSDPAVMTAVKSDIEQACVSKRSIVSLDGAVFYASPDGLMRLASSGSELITQSIFTAQQWQALFNPESIHAYGHDGKYVAFYEANGSQAGFVFDSYSKQFMQHDLWYQTGYTDLRNDTLYLLNNKTILQWDKGAGLTGTWKSKVFTLPQRTGFNCAQVEALGYPLTFRLYADGALVHTKQVASREPFRLPVGQKRDWEIELITQHPVYNVIVAQSMQEIASG